MFNENIIRYELLRIILFILISCFTAGCIQDGSWKGTTSDGGTIKIITHQGRIDTIEVYFGEHPGNASTGVWFNPMRPYDKINLRRNFETQNIIDDSITGHFAFFSKKVSGKGKHSCSNSTAPGIPPCSSFSYTWEAELQ